MSKSSGNNCISPIVCHLYQEGFHNEISLVGNKSALQSLLTALTDAVEKGRGELSITVEKDMCCRIEILLNKTGINDIPEVYLSI